MCVWKQKNKGFKSRHATKSSLKNAAKGKIDNASPSASSAASTHRAKAAQEKKNRMNHRSQIRSSHQKAVGQDSKFFSTVSGGKAVPRVVSVIPLHSAVRCEDFGRAFVEVLGLGEEEKERVVGSLSDRGSWIMRYISRASSFISLSTSLRNHLLNPRPISTAAPRNSRPPSN